LVLVLDIDVFQVNRFQDHLDIGLFFFGRFILGGEGVKDELVIPVGVVPGHPDHGILQTDVFEFYLILEKEPVRDLQFQSSGIEQGVLFLVPDQGAFQVQFVEEADVDLFDADFGVEIFGKAFGNLPDDQVLCPFSLY
jgi:hypothetical protein